MTINLESLREAAHAERCSPLASMGYARERYLDALREMYERGDLVPRSQALTQRGAS